MIDRGSFEKRWIESIPGISDIGGRLVVERTIHAFYCFKKSQRVASKANLYSKAS